MNPDGGQQISLSQQLAAVAAQRLDKNSWEDFGTALEGMNDQQVLHQALTALQGAGGHAEERAQAAVYVTERLAELGSDQFSRMLRWSAKLGVELQDLNSEIYEAVDDGSKPVTVIATAFAGRNALWQCTADGKNLEFVGTEIGVRLELSRVLAEMVRVYQAMVAQGPGRYAVGGDCFDVVKLSGQAQPQYNIEIPLDLVEAFVADLGAGDGLYNAFFGVSGKWWKQEDTAEEIRVVREAAAVIAALTRQDLAGLVPAAVLADADALRAVRGFLLLLAMAAVHQTEFPSVVLKDQPLLHKCNLAAVADSLQELDLLSNGSAATALDLLTTRKAVLTPGQQAQRQLAWFRGELVKGEDPSWTRDDTLIELWVDSPRWTSKRRRTQVIMELRRVPILPPAQWVAACLAAFDHFVADPGRRYN